MCVCVYICASTCEWLFVGVYECVCAYSPSFNISMSLTQSAYKKMIGNNWELLWIPYIQD